MSRSEIQYDQAQYQDPMQMYRTLTDVISDVAADIDGPDDIKYSVIWQTANRNHGSDYRVVDTEPLALEETLIIEGQSRGGRYQVVPRGSGPAAIRYLRPDGGIGWTEEATELIIMYGRWNYDPDEDGGIRDWLDRRLS